jgi:hypothetical protein
MADKTWEELLVFKLEGARFDEHQGVELRDLEGLVYLRAVLVDVAKALWKEQHGRKRIPDRIETEIDVRIRGFTDGCVETVVSMGRPVPRPAQPTLFPEPLDERLEFFDSLHGAAEEVERALGAVQRGTKLPVWFPEEAISNLDRMSRRLDGTEYVTLRAVRARAPYSGLKFLTTFDDAATPRTLPDPPRLDAGLRDKVRTMAVEIEQERAKDKVLTQTLAGEVTMADWPALSARLILDGPDGDEIPFTFTRDDERKVTTALDKHATTRLRMRGNAHVDKRGRIRRFEAKAVEIDVIPSPDAPSEALFERLVLDDPGRLIEMLRSNELAPTLLTYAAEIAGRLKLAVPALVALLGHPAPIVREGAVYGLADHLDDRIRAALRTLADQDPSPGVRAAAEGVLSE